MPRRTCESSSPRARRAVSRSTAGWRGCTSTRSSSGSWCRRSRSSSRCSTRCGGRTTRVAGSPRRPAAACSFVGSALEAIGGFAAIRGEVIDDVTLAAAVKRLGLPIRLAVSREHVRSVRAYRTSGCLLAHGPPDGVHAAPALVAPARRDDGRAGRSLRRAAGARRARPERGRRRAWPAAGRGRPGWSRRSSTCRRCGSTGSSRSWALTLPLAGLLYGAMTVDSALGDARGERAVW